MKKYYLFGKETNIEKNMRKIESRSVRCHWHDKDDLLEKDFIGFFNEKGECFDNCNELGAKSWKKYSELKEKNKETFEKFKTKVNFSIDEIDKFISLSNSIQEVQSDIRSKQKDVSNGFVFDDTKIGGSKKTRRFKKDNRRFLTEKEIVSLNKQIEKLQQKETTLCKKLKIEETLDKIIRSLYNINLKTAEGFSENYGYGDSVFLFKTYKDNMDRLKQKVNNIEFNNLKEKDKEIKLKEVNIFQEAYDKVLEIVKEDLEDEEKMTVKKSRQVTNKAKFYIDENGVRHELDSSVSQVVLR